MRYLLFTLSSLFFVFAGIIIFRAMEIPDHTVLYSQDMKVSKANAVVPQNINKSEQMEEERLANEEMLKEMQEKITMLEVELESRNSDSQMDHAPAPVMVEPAKETRVLAVLGSGTFSSGQVVISRELMKDIEDLVKEISSASGYRVTIEGHTDNIPIGPLLEKKYNDNMDLSFIRAKAIANILMEKGVPGERITVIGHGDTRPISSNDTVEGRAKNRRVEIKLVPEEKEI